MKRVSLIFFACLAFISCQESNQTSQSLLKKEITNDSLLQTGTIVYEVILKPQESWDEWEKENIKNLELETYINGIFDAIYRGELTAVNYETSKPYTIEEVKSIEADENYARTKIGKIQFYENWGIDKNRSIPTKEIDSLIFGYEAADEKGNIFGYRANIKVIFPN